MIARIIWEKFVNPEETLVRKHIRHLDEDFVTMAIYSEEKIEFMR